MSIAVVFYLVTLLAADGVCRLAVAAPTDATDVAAMQAIAKSTGADRSLGWGVKSADPCDGTWSGVHCNNDLGHVTAISASHAGLHGTLSGTDLVELRFLAELDLSFNNLGDDLPILPRPLNLLTNLNLRNQLVHAIPPFFGKDPDSGAETLTGRLGFISGMTRLVEIHVAGNAFYGPLPDVFGLASLKVFDAADNQLCGPVKFPPGVTVNVRGNANIGKSCQ
ncbi:unnamed protein product [Alopecurus aequalis]